MLIEIRSVVFTKRRWKDCKDEGTLLNDGNALYLDWGGGYTGVHTDQKLLNSKHICILLLVWELGVYGKSLYLPLSFVVNLKLL